ncbi:hypothetical protein GCM10007171_08510 [Dickeya fangzhongdai]|nr:hypothetical protein GCM10007171_08510 [Dickeya fangzhongdai]
MRRNQKQNGVSFYLDKKENLVLVYAAVTAMQAHIRLQARMDLSQIENQGSVKPCRRPRC